MLNNNENTKLIYGLLQDIFKNVWEQQKYSEVKNGVILTLNIAILTILLKFSVEVHSLKFKIAFYFFIVLFIVHIFLIIKSFYPKDINKEISKWTNDDINIFFYGDIQKLNNYKYLNIVLSKYDLSEKDINKNFLLDLTNQIVKLSEITQSKYSAFKDSIFRMYILTILFFVYYTCTLF